MATLLIRAHNAFTGKTATHIVTMEDWDITRSIAMEEGVFSCQRAEAGHYEICDLGHGMIYTHYVCWDS